MWKSYLIQKQQQVSHRGFGQSHREANNQCNDSKQDQQNKGKDDVFLPNERKLLISNVQYSNYQNEIQKQGLKYVLIQSAELNNDHINALCHHCSLHVLQRLPMDWTFILLPLAVSKSFLEENLEIHPIGSKLQMCNHNSTGPPNFV